MSRVGLLGALWGMAGITLLLGAAVVRLSHHALEAWSMPFTPVHWAAWLFSLVWMAYSEGYRGFQRAFSPRVAARVHHLIRHPTALHVALAPLFCMAYFHTTRRRRLVTFILTGMIIGFVLVARQLPQPWRGILDVGVVAGLCWGLVVTWAMVLRWFRAPSCPYPAELPPSSAEEASPRAAD